MKASSLAAEKNARTLLSILLAMNQPKLARSTLHRIVLSSVMLLPALLLCCASAGAQNADEFLMLQSGDSIESVSAVPEGSPETQTDELSLGYEPNDGQLPSPGINRSETGVQPPIEASLAKPKPTRLGIGPRERNLSENAVATVQGIPALVEDLPEEAELIPLLKPELPTDVELTTEDELVNLVATDARLQSVLRMIAEHHGINLVLGPDVSGSVTVSIHDVRLEEVLDAICGVSGFSWNRVGNLLYVTGQTGALMNPSVQGRRLQVYQLNYVAATDVEGVVNGLLTSSGKAYISEAAQDDELRTRETLIVEDVESSHQRVAEYLAQVDVRPKQVLVEAHVLQIALTNEQRHGIDLRAVARAEGARLTLAGTSFAEASPTGPSVAFRVDGTDMGSVIELIRNCTNSRTLASPKLSVVNHQEARIQIGQRLPYTVATTTQTTTIESVQFLEVGIVLTVRPIIMEDGNVLMNVLPKVSGGKIGDTGFPEEETTELQTTIMMPSGSGVVIGGLIREDNIQNNAIVPGFGRIPILGKLFQRNSDESRRNELVIALVAHVLEDTYSRQHELFELETTLPPHASSELTVAPRMQVIAN